MEKDKTSNTNMISDVIKNGVEAGLKIAYKQYHMISDIQHLISEKEKLFRMLGEQVFQLIDQGRMFAPAIMQATFRAAKEIIERITYLEEDKKRKESDNQNANIKLTEKEKRTIAKKADKKSDQVNEKKSSNKSKSVTKKKKRR